MIKYVHCARCLVSLMSVFFVVLIAELVLAVEIRVLGQRGADLLLLPVASGVGDLDVATFGGGFIDNLLQSDIELAVRLLC